MLAALAVAGAGAVHALYRAAERWEAARPGRSRDAVMLPALLAGAAVVAFVADRVGPALLRDGGFALFAGFAIGQRLPRPPRRRR